MKRKLLAAALAVLCLSVAVYGTVAYFTAEDTATNVITAGNVKIALNEAAITEDGETVAFEDVTGVVPGAEISKIVTVDNTGDNAAYVRIKVVKEITSENEPEGEFDPSLIVWTSTSKTGPKRMDITITTRRLRPVRRPLPCLQR